MLVGLLGQVHLPGASGRSHRGPPGRHRRDDRCNRDHGLNPVGEVHAARPYRHKTARSGTMVFGMDPDELTVAGLGDEAPKKLRDRLYDLVNRVVVPVPVMTIADYQVEGKTVLVMEVEPGDQLAATDPAAADAAHQDAVADQRSFAAAATAGGESVARMAEADRIDAKRWR